MSRNRLRENRQKLRITAFSSEAPGSFSLVAEDEKEKEEKGKELVLVRNDSNLEYVNSRYRRNLS